MVEIKFIANYYKNILKDKIKLFYVLRLAYRTLTGENKDF